jgi:hypothetical protein
VYAKSLFLQQGMSARLSRRGRCVSSPEPGGHVDGGHEARDQVRFVRRTHTPHSHPGYSHEREQAGYIGI